MPSGRALFLIFIVFCVIVSTLWYFSPIGLYLQAKLERSREQLAVKLKTKQKKEDEKTILY